MIFKNLLLQYKGGGYDGCIWEWNFCFWNKCGQWHNIFESGCGGLKTEEDAKKYLINNKQYCRQEHYLFRLTKPKAIKEFIDNTNCALVKHVLEKLNDEEYGFTIKCPICHRKISPDEMEMDPSNYHGDGGVGIVYEGWMCSECLNNGSCIWCGEFAGAKEIDKNKGYCEYHSDYATKQKFKHDKWHLEKMQKELPELILQGNALYNRFCNWYVNETGRRDMWNVLHWLREYTRKCGNRQDQNEIEYYVKNIYPKRMEVAV